MTSTVSTSVVSVFAPGWAWKFDRRITSFLFYWPAFTFYDFSAYLSVCLGVMRCACVAMPLHFKLVFTKPRTITTVVVIFIATVLLRIPVLSVHSIGIKINPLTNQSYAYLKVDKNRIKVFINDTINRTSLPWVAFIIMVACVLILSLKLAEASKIRQPHIPVSSSGLANPGPSTDKQEPRDQSSLGNNNTHTHKISTKEAQVVQSVVLVCVIFILSQLPFLLYSSARLIYAEFDEDTHLRFLFGFCSNISLTCSFLNASVNIFVYFRFNSKYRSVIQSKLCAKPVKS
ncbi:chemosensory receptor C [Elysia marginata]|uniref:Chemosensory receptor C n=1 Tax=Elysia marginata TaxID=1093978 RepID=A0AAV4GJY4_9GAST|nr:chemosensory receptor C [Elysia marginata]